MGVLESLCSSEEKKRLKQAREAISDQVLKRNGDLPPRADE